MKVELDIADDSELRNAIKDLIKGEVKSVMRSEIRGILKDLTAEMVIPKDAASLETLLRTELRTVIREDLKTNEYNWTSDLIRSMAREEIGKILKDIFAQDQFSIERNR